MVRSQSPSYHTLMVWSREPAMTRPSGTTDTQSTALVCPASVTTWLENCRALIALRAATLTTLHVGAALPIWCAVVMRAMMCCTTSAGRSMSNFGGIAATIFRRSAHSVEKVRGVNGTSATLIR